MSITKNLLNHWRKANTRAQFEGRTWYSTARQTVCRLARQHGKTPATVAGVIAATSPRMHWSRNVRVAEELLTGREVRGVFRANLDKARRIIAGAKPLVVLGGNKVRAFYRALLGDPKAAVVDVWMLRAAGLSPEVRLTDRLYKRISDLLGVLARRVRLTVAELQATLWVVVRGRAT